MGMQNMLQKTFLEFDDELLQRLLDPQASVGAKRAALAGSCAVMACIDGPNVYVANTGDCRAVLVKKAGKEFQSVDLTVDQTLENPAERKRILSEHPGELEEVLTARDRILGGLQPARAFGDAKYKVSIDMHKQVLSRIIGSKSMRPGYATPPYVTAKPVVSHHRIEPGADVCMVLATDGLWDKLESSQVASLLGVHAQTLPVSEANFHEDDRESVDMGPNSGFVMADSNPATHLIRNALGGGSHAALCKQLGTIPPHTRKIRDDITCVVVHFTPPADKAKL
jgi:pyruvate dehydrogenase phosphatase